MSIQKILLKCFNNLTFPSSHKFIHLYIIFPVFIFVYLGPISLIFQNPFSYHPLQGILILGISIYMAWKKRTILSQIQIHPNFLMGTLITILSSLLLIGGKFSGTPLVEGLSLPIGILGLCCLLFGSGYSKILFWPISYLIFLFPVFDKILVNYSSYLELAAAVIGATLLKIIGMPLIRYGNYIELPHITLHVAQACNGINHIVSLTALNLFIISQIRMTRLRQMLLIILTILTAIFLNGLRIGLIGIWTKYFGTISFHGPFNIFYSSFVFIVGFLVLISFALLFAKRKHIEAVVKKDIHINPKTQFKKNIAYLSYSIAIIILVMTWVYQFFFYPLPVSASNILKEIPLLVGNWNGKNVDSLNEPYETGEFDSVLKRIYYDQFGNEIKLFIGYLNLQNEGKEIHKYPYKLYSDEVSTVRIDLHSLNISAKIKHIQYHKGDSLNQGYFWYSISNRIIADRYRAKIASIFDALTKKRTNAAIVVVSTRINNESHSGERMDFAIQFVNMIIPLIQSYLDNDKNG